jgi:hypothetical protein
MKFSVATALLCAAIVVWGFAPSFLVPLLHGRPRATLVVDLHAAAFFGWIVLYVVQTALAGSRVEIHRRVGVLAFALVPIMVVTGVTVALGQAARGGDDARAFLLVPLTDISLFAVLAGWALHARGDRAMHQRLMLVATVALLPPAMGRALAMGSTVTSLAGDSILVIAAVRDLIQRGRVHRAYLLGGALVLATHALRATLADTATWQHLASWLT